MPSSSTPASDARAQSASSPRQDAAHIDAITIASALQRFSPKSASCRLARPARRRLAAGRHLLAAAASACASFHTAGSPPDTPPHTLLPWLRASPRTRHFLKKRRFQEVMAARPASLAVQDAADDDAPPLLLSRRFFVVSFGLLSASRAAALMWTFPARQP